MNMAAAELGVRDNAEMNWEVQNLSLIDHTRLAWCDFLYYPGKRRNRRYYCGIL